MASAGDSRWQGEDDAPPEIGPVARRPGRPRRAAVHASDFEEAAMSPMEEAFELLLIEEADAWFEYLEATRGQTETRYKELEPWAWARLSQRLRAIRARRARLRPAAA